MTVPHATKPDAAAIAPREVWISLAIVAAAIMIGFFLPGEPKQFGDNSVLKHAWVWAPVIMILMIAGLHLLGKSARLHQYVLILLSVPFFFFLAGITAFSLMDLFGIQLFPAQR